jgi:ketosteroid isomerase-like protein
MSQENVELVYRTADALNRHDIDAVLALCDPEVEFIPRLVEVDGGGSYRGHDGVRSWWENLFGVWPDFKSEVDEVRDLGDVTVARVRMSGQGIASEATTDQTSWVVTEWRDSKTIWMRVFQNETEAFDAAGLSE